jgi:hypothetical protein
MKSGLLGAGLLFALAGCSSPEALPRTTRPKVYLFVTTDCPLANGYAPEINRIVARYTPLGIEFAIVYVDLDLTPEDARRHARDYGYAAELIVDSDHRWVERCGVEVTPEAALVLPDGTIAYRGRIDDRGVSLGRIRAEPTRCDLREALDAVLAGRPVAEPRTSAVGCFIPTRP